MRLRDSRPSPNVSAPVKPEAPGRQANIAIEDFASGASVVRWPDVRVASIAMH
jgi:hypothetical protein